MNGPRGSGRPPGSAAKRSGGIACEVCGAPVTTPYSVEMDGAVLRVCQSCSRRGRPVQARPAHSPHPPPPPVAVISRNAPAPRASALREIEPDLEVDPDYAPLVRHAREKLGLTQEALGKMMNVKPSLIHHVETGKMKPDLILARSLMHHLKVDLLVSSEELDSGAA